MSVFEYKRPALAVSGVTVTARLLCRCDAARHRYHSIALYLPAAVLGGHECHSQWAVQSDRTAT